MLFHTAIIPREFIPYYKDGRARIKFPVGTELEGFSTWVSGKLLIERDEEEYAFKAPDTFTFKASKQRYNKDAKQWETMEERTISARQISDIFSPGAIFSEEEV